MSEYIHERVLQDYIIENLGFLNLITMYQNTSYKIIEAKINRSGTFWDLEGKLENGVWIPIEVEWISQNFLSHKHHLSKDFKLFKNKSGVLLVLRKNKEIEGVCQISILENITERKILDSFKKWFKVKAEEEYVEQTFKQYFTENYHRENPRILLYHISKNAEKNYFELNNIYKKNENSSALLGFSEASYKNNAFIRDIQENDIFILINATGGKCKRIY